MNNGSRRYARRAADVAVAVALVVFEAVALLGVILGAMPFVFTGVWGEWLAPVCLGVLAVCAGLTGAGAWTVRLRVTAMVQGLVTGCCLVTVLIGLSGGLA
ncbi:hypothetical protein ACFWBB_16480 [Streptomyces sp. NPDC060000]|uniref:hypothetical protein n=1 Tax=Streptomyces sp. NPDC060000 TaxID=3347031 RepID=UPI003680A3BD